MARRALEFFRAERVGGARATGWSQRAGRRASPGLSCRRPVRLEQPITEHPCHRVADSYLACPYRYYLRHVLKLTPWTMRQRSWAPIRSARSCTKCSGTSAGTATSAPKPNPDKIRRFLHHALNQYVTDPLTAPHPLPAVAVQIDPGTGAAGCVCRTAGERTMEAGKSRTSRHPGGEQPACLDLGGGVSMTLRGRSTGSTTETVSGRSSTTRRATRRRRLRRRTSTSEAWVDLQLPLYVHLARTLHIDGPLQLGYIVLPKDVSKVGPLMADWNGNMLAAARRAGDRRGAVGSTTRSSGHRQSRPPRS